MDITKKWDKIILTWDKKEIVFDNETVLLDWLLLDFPGEYEKSWIMAHVILKNWNIIFQMRFLDKNIWYICHDELEIDEEVADFFWDIDVLVIKWTKNSIKIFENLEAKYVVPYGETKDIFFSTLWQHPESVTSMKIKEQLGENEVIFVNLD
ncbi:MAG: hypothetical protein ACD_2C00030G0001 [uncultured bacterium (gcode 4)]|uniref:Uncharacterized protein n=1 Tax=uncultured bacterium (gcode 4) TaxID=1234023 RepID=K2G4M4_9BACT|nr:MAG: hypothetical protein ACD_2C00030G0001 [uncultured bacterium (gcode 4)]